MGMKYSSETSADFYRTTRCHIPEVESFHFSSISRNTIMVQHLWQACV
jgi:hypothetical protein